MRTRTLWLNILPTLDAILNANSLTEAAEKAFLTQPALSIALRKARSHFDDELVVFGQGGATLTELGRELKPRIAAALQTSRDALDLELTFEPKASSRTIRIMTNSYLEMAFLPFLLRKIYVEAPNVEVVVEPFRPLPKNPNLLESVDIVIASNFFATNEYRCMDLFEDRITGLVWNENSLVGDSMPLDKWLTLRHATAATANVEAPIVGTLQSNKSFALHSQSAVSLPYMIVGTDIVVTGMSRYCQQFTKVLPLRIVDIVESGCEDDECDLSVAVYWKPHRSNEPFMQWLIQLCEIAGKEFVD